MAVKEPFRQRAETYLGQPSLYEVPKEKWKALAALIAEAGLGTASLMDVGCGVGDLLHLIRSRFPGYRLTGIDTSDALLAQARSVPGLAGLTLRKDDALTFVYRDYQAEPFDLITCSGVLPIFDEPEPLLGNLLANARAGGRIYVFSMFNPDDIDVRIRYRDNLHQPDEWQCGQNIHSVQTISRWLSGRVQSFRFVPFEMPFDLPKQEAYPHRSWTFRAADGRRFTTSGLSLLYQDRFLEICR
jgi:SAM-dependent methyltransferase